MVGLLKGSLDDMPNWGTRGYKYRDNVREFASASLDWILFGMGRQRNAPYTAIMVMHPEGSVSLGNCRGPRGREMRKRLIETVDELAAADPV